MWKTQSEKKKETRREKKKQVLFLEQSHCAAEHIEREAGSPEDN